MNAVEVIIPGEPVGQGRPRATVSKAGKLRVYSPKNSDSWRGFAATLMKQACPEPFLGPVQVEVFAVFALPKSRQSKRTPVQRRSRCLKKPDWDNIGKIVSDAGNGVLWMDDAQIASASVNKFYGKQDEAPYVWVRVTELP